MTSSIQIIGSRGGGGAENFYVRLLRAMRDEGMDSAAVNPPGSVVADRLGDRVPQCHVPMGNVFSPLARWRLRRLIAARAPAIVQTWMGRATRLVRLRPGHGPVHVARLGGYYDLKGYRHAHAWIGNTRGICDYLVREGLPARRVFHIGNFVEPAVLPETGSLARLRRSLAIPDDALVILALGRLHPNKGFDTLIDAFARMPAEIGARPLHLLVVGDGPLRDELRAQAIRGHVDTRLHWAGWQDDTTPFYALADLFVCPSRHEPLGNVILEAWAHTRPVVATRSQGALELIEADHDGLLVPVDDPAALAQALGAALADEAGRRQLAERGLATLLARHSRRSVLDCYADTYAHLAGDNACAA